MIRITPRITATLLFAKQDLKFKAFHSTLIPTTDAKSIIGVRTPDLRTIAKEFASHSDVEKFLTTLPHKYYDENQVHAFILSLIKDYDDCVAYIDAFLPYVENCATCDQMRPKAFAKAANRAKLLKDVQRWINAPVTDVYTVAARLLGNLIAEAKQAVKENESYIKGETQANAIVWKDSTAGLQESDADGEKVFVEAVR